MTKCQHYWLVPNVQDGHTVPSEAYKDETAVEGTSVCKKCGAEKSEMLTFEPGEKNRKKRWNDGLTLKSKKTISK